MQTFLSYFLTQISNRKTVHYLALAGAIALGGAIRFWYLDFKPLWQDEVITALFSLGRSYDDVPQGVVFPLSFLAELFTLKPEATCFQIAHKVAAQSTHPPLFFCLMHRWLSWLSFIPDSWVWKLRSLPAFMGVGAIAAVYCLNRVAFSPAAGLVGAVVMAISPFGVYLSQEARHYTLPVLLITLALIGLIQIQQDFYHRHHLRPLTLLCWVAVNSIGLYVHYFFFLALIAQIVTLAISHWYAGVSKLKSWQVSVWKQSNTDQITDNQKQTPAKYLLLYVSLSVLPFVFFLPWVPMLWEHFGGSATDWFSPPRHIAPLYQIMSSWVLMVIALPVENQPLWIAIPTGLLMVVFASLLGWQVVNRLRVKRWHSVYLKRTRATYLAIFTLSCFTLCVLLELLAIVYLLRKDITVALRYNFVYYPAICALLGASLVQKSKGEREHLAASFSALSNIQHPLLAVLLVGALSCILVVSNLAFQKPYNPQRVAENMNLKLAPVMVVMANTNYQDVALGLSFALTLDQARASTKRISKYDSAYFAFLHHDGVQTPSGYKSFWPKLSHLKILTDVPFYLWVIAPELKQVDYPYQLKLASPKTCTQDPTHFQDIDVSYQLYRCD